MSSLSSDTLINPQDLFDISQSSLVTGTSNDAATLGCLATTGDGRYYRFIQAGAVALVPGTLQQSIAEATGNENLAVAAAAIGALSVTTTTTVTVAANLYAGGYIAVTVTPGQGYLYQIGSHAAATTAAVTLNLTDPIVVALTTSSRIDLVASPFLNIIQSPITTRTGNVVGVAIAATPISYYGWVQTRGPANVLAAGTVVVGEQVGQATAVAGACTATTGVLADIGYAMTGIADTEYGAIYLNIS
jgi:hypothetical protein